MQDPVKTALDGIYSFRAIVSTIHIECSRNVLYAFIKLSCEAFIRSS